METSAKNGLNTDELFCEIGRTLFDESLKNNNVDKVRKYKYKLFCNDKIQNVDQNILKKIKSEKKVNNKDKKGCC